MDKNKDLKQKLRNKINEKRIQRGVAPSNIHNINNDDDLMDIIKNMMRDVKLPYIQRLKIMERNKVMEKKYKILQTKHEPIYRSILEDEIDIKDIPTLEMMLSKRQAIKNNEISAEDADERMKEQLYNKYKIDDKKDDI